MSKRLLGVLVSASILGGCGSSNASYDSDSYTYEDTGKADKSGEREPLDEDAAREEAKQEVADEGYDGPCTIDCSGHDAGFAWAAEGHEDKGISSSQSFDEGQEAYDEAVEERVEEARQAYEDGEDQ